MKFNKLLLFVLGCIVSIFIYAFANKSTLHFTNQIGYINKEGKFVAVTNKQLSGFFYQTNHITQSASTSNISIENYIDKQTNIKSYFIKAKFMDGAYVIHLASKLQKMNETQYVIIGETCSCKSKECATSAGCDVLVPMPPCVCSPCNGDCEKTNTKTSGVDDFF